MIRRLLALLFRRRGAPSAGRTGRRLDDGVGRSTRRHLTALHEHLSDPEWAELVPLGRDEALVRDLREQLRPLTLREGVLATQAGAVREEMDAFLSEPEGVLARTLSAYPARDLATARDATRRTRERARRLRDGAQSLLDAAPVVDEALQRIDRLEASFARALPSSWETIGGAAFASRAAGLHSADAARRFVASLDETEASLASQHARSLAALAALRKAADDCGLTSRVAGSEPSVEQELARLREALRRHAIDLTERLSRQAVAAADAQLRHLGTTRADDFVRPPAARSLVPGHAVLRRWSELHAVRRRLAASAQSGLGTKTERRKGRRGGP